MSVAAYGRKLLFIDNSHSNLYEIILCIVVLMYAADVCGAFPGAASSVMIDASACIKSPGPRVAFAKCTL